MAVKAFEGWAIVELMGRQMVAGFCSEQPVAGLSMLRVDVPATADIEHYTKFFGPSAVYAITPTTEEIAKAAARRINERPVSLYIVPVPPPAEVPALEVQFEDTERDDPQDDRWD